MINRIARNIGGVILTMVVVSIICFFMASWSEGDRAERILSSQGLHPLTTDAANYHSTHDRISKELGLDLPLFYFSILPSYLYHKPGIDLDWKKKLQQKLQAKRYKKDYSSAYVATLSDLEALWTSDDIPSAWQFLKFQTKPELVDQFLYIIRHETDSVRVITEVERLDSLHYLMQEDKIKFYYPVVFWNGINNQYHHWIKGFLWHGNELMTYDGQKILPQISRSLGWTLSLVFFSLIFSMVISIVLSVYLHIYQQHVWTKVILFILNAFFAVPIFWLATLFIVFFTTKEYGDWTDIFPSPMVSIHSTETTFWSIMKNQFSQLILPVICIVLVNLPIIVRLLISSLKTEVNKPYVLALKARGLQTPQLYLRHLIPNSLIPLVTLISNYFPASLAGSLIIEVIFNIPGMGRLMYDAILNGELNMVFSILLLITLVTAITLHLADAIYTLVNPKMRSNT